MKKHFAELVPDINNAFHKRCNSIYEQIAWSLNIPLETISINKVIRECSKFSSTKSTDSVDTSAFLLKTISNEYIKLITVSFNKYLEKGEFFTAVKHAKIVCIPNERYLSISRSFTHHMITLKYWEVLRTYNR